MNKGPKVDFTGTKQEVQHTKKRRYTDIDNFYVLWLNSQERRHNDHSSPTIKKRVIGMPVFTEVSHANIFVVFGEKYKESEPLFAKLRLQTRDELILRIAGYILTYLIEKYETYRGMPLKQDDRLNDQAVIDLMVNKVADFLKKDTFLFHDTIWENLCDWFGMHLTDWILEEMERTLGEEKIDKLDKVELNRLFDKFLTHNLEENKKFVSDFTEIINHYTKNWIEEIIESMNLESYSLEKIEGILEIEINNTTLSPRKDISLTVSEQRNLLVMSNAPYQTIREAISNGYFKKFEHTPWPTAELRKATIEGTVQLKLVGSEQHTNIQLCIKKAWKQEQQLSELAVDVYDALCIFFLSKARHHKDFVEIQLDDLLSIRGIKPKLSGNGRRGGYEPGQRQQVLEALSIIQSLWIDLKKAVIYEKGKAVQMQLRGRAFIFKDFEDKDVGNLDPTSEKKLVFSVDEIFAKYLYGSGRQVAFLPVEALQYNPYREKWEKKLLRYLSWRWRTQARKGDFLQPHKVSTLLEMIGKSMNERTPSRTRDRLEQALDKLLEDRVIASWHYEKWDELVAASKGWRRVWENSTIIIEPPSVIIENYRPIERNPKSVHKPISSSLLTDTTIEQLQIGQQVRDMRKALNLSLIETAEEIEISTSYLSNIERELKIPSSKVLNRIVNWMNRQDLI